MAHSKVPKNLIFRCWDTNENILVSIGFHFTSFCYQTPLNFTHWNFTCEISQWTLRLLLTQSNLPSPTEAPLILSSQTHSWSWWGEKNMKQNHGGANGVIKDIQHSGNQMPHLYTNWTILLYVRGAKCAKLQVTLYWSQRENSLLRLEQI